MTLGFSLRVEGRRNMPEKGAALVVANHQSFLDPPTIGLANNRRMAYLTRKTLFDNPVFGIILRLVNSVPIDQDGIGIEGIRNILTRLEQGWPVLVFPEGARTENGDLQLLKPGISMLIKRAKAPIVPVAIAGSYYAWPRWRAIPIPSPLFLAPTERTVAVVVGKPISAEKLAGLSREEQIRFLTDEITRLLRRAEQLRRK